MAYNEPGRLLAIGDVHGELAKLEALLDAVRPGVGDELVLLGDYVDRGPAGLDVLRRVRGLRDELGAVCLQGNHERMMLDYLRGHDHSWLLPCNGGRATRDALGALDAAERTDLLSFVEGLPTMHRRTVAGQEHVFVHAGIRPGVDLDAQDLDDLVWIRGDFLGRFTGDGRRYAVGHTPVQLVSPGRCTPLQLPSGVVMVDTGSYMANGRVSCVDVLTGHCWCAGADGVEEGEVDEW